MRKQRYSDGESIVAVQQPMAGWCNGSDHSTTDLVCGIFQPDSVCMSTVTISSAIEHLTEPKLVWKNVSVTFYNLISYFFKILSSACVTTNFGAYVGQKVLQWVLRWKLSWQYDLEIKRWSVGIGTILMMGYENMIIYHSIQYYIVYTVVTHIRLPPNYNCWQHVASVKIAFHGTYSL